MVRAPLPTDRDTPFEAGKEHYTSCTGGEQCEYDLGGYSIIRTSA